MQKNVSLIRWKREAGAAGVGCGGGGLEVAQEEEEEEVTFF